MYLLSFFLLDVNVEFTSAGAVTVGIFSVTWTCLIIGTSYELSNTSRQVVSKEKLDPARQRFSRRIRNYCVINIVFGMLLCVFQVLAFMIDTWFKDEMSAILINAVFDLSILGVSYG